MQLQRRHAADMAAARTILMAMTGCALLSSPGTLDPVRPSKLSPRRNGVIAYVYIARQARRFQVRIDDLTRLDAANDSSRRRSEWSGEDLQRCSAHDHARHAWHGNGARH